ncbi:MAG: glycosyltransferase family 2 protein [Verrucomicrobiales bacterium]
MGKPEISVVIPCYQASGTLERAVASVRRQDFTAWELLLVDDGSTDGTGELAEALAREDDRIRVLRRAHAGVSAAAKGRFLARMDADDESRPERLRKQRAFLEENGDCGLMSSLVNFAGDRTEAGGYARHVDWANACVTPGEIALARFRDLPVPNPTLMMRREVWERVGPYHEGDFPEDYEWFLRSQALGVRAGKVAELLYDWHDPPTRLTRNDGRYSPEAFQRVKAPFLAQAIVRAGAGERDLWLWGAGRPARKMARFLEEAWKPAKGLIDIDPRKIGQRIAGRPVVSPANLPGQEEAVIVSFVGTRGAGEAICEELQGWGRVEGRDFWLAASS